MTPWGRRVVNSEPIPNPGSFRTMAASDHIIMLMLVPNTDYRYRVQVTKCRDGQISAHAFMTLSYALDFMRSFSESRGW